MAYSEDQRTKIVNDICARIAEGSSLRAVLRNEDMPDTQTFLNWLDKDKKKVEQYTRAMELRADFLFDEILEISDNTIQGTVIETDDHGRTKEKTGDMLGHRRLQIDARKWALSKMSPKKYSDKLQVDNTGFTEQPLFPDVPTNDSNK